MCFENESWSNRCVKCNVVQRLGTNLIVADRVRESRTSAGHGLVDPNHREDPAPGGLQFRRAVMLHKYLGHAVVPRGFPVVPNQHPSLKRERPAEQGQTPQERAEIQPKQPKIEPRSS